MLVKLAFKNAKSQLIDYFIYVLATSFAIMTYFSFIAMASNRPLQNVVTEISINSRLEFGSALILFFIILFIFYANSFFIQRRRKEIGLYNLIGVTKFQVSLIFLLENLVIGLISLLIGITLGILFTKLFAMLLLKVMGITAQTNFFFSWWAIQQTILFFLIIFIGMGFVNMAYIAQFKLVDLFKTKENISAVGRPGKITYLKGLLGIMMILVSYLLAYNLFDCIRFWNRNIHIVDSGFILPLILLLAFWGTILFFKYSILLLVATLKKHKGSYYQGMRMINVSNLLSRLKRNANSLWLITILSAVGITTIGSAAMVYSYGKMKMDNTSPAPLAVADTKKASIDNILAKYQVEPMIKTVATYKIIGAKYALKNRLDNEKDKMEGPVSIMSVSDYNEAAVRQVGLKPLKLRGNHGVFVFDTISWFQSNNTVKSPNHDLPIHLNQANLAAISMTKIIGTAPYGTESAIGTLIVVSDEYYHQVKPDFEAKYYAYYFGKGKKVNQALESIYHQFAKLKTKYQYVKKKGTTSQNFQNTHYELGKIGTTEGSLVDTTPRSVVSVREPELKLFRKLFGFFMYIATFVTLIFMIATGSIIMLKQLAEAGEDIDSYQLLKKIGVSTAEIRRAVYKQTLVVFMLPILLASTHAFFAISIVRSLTDYPDLRFTSVVCGIFVIIYLVFYFFTARNYNRIVNTPYRDNNL